MIITIFGYSGFIGSSIVKKLKQKYKINKINVRKINLNLTDKIICKVISKRIKNSQIVINCSASLKPKSNTDFFLNERFPFLVQKSIYKIKRKIRFIHFSSLNVLIDQRIDDYSLSKKRGEKYLKKKNTAILRLPIIKQNKISEKNKGNFNFFENYLKINFLKIYPMIYPGHIYQPIDLTNLCKFVEDLIIKKKINYIYNLIGKEKKTLWDLFKIISKKKNKKILKIDIRFLSKVFFFLKNTKFVRNNDTLSQIFSIDHSKFNKKNITIL